MLLFIRLIVKKILKVCIEKSVFYTVPNVDEWEFIAFKNLEINGKKWHLMKLAEECSELSAAILKHVNKGSSEEDIQEEASDVLLGLEMLARVYGTGIMNVSRYDKQCRIKRKLQEQMRDLSGV